MSYYELHNEECLHALKGMDDEIFDLVYLDPPFFTQKNQKLHTRDRTREYIFSDIWASHTEYAGFLIVRLEQIRRVLKPSGSLFFHCDRNASHIVRILLDKIFGVENFRSEIIWCYKRWSNHRRVLLPAHQTIYFYTKSENYKFKHFYQEYSPSTNVDQILQKRARDEFGKAIYARDMDGNIIRGNEKRGVPLSDVWDIPYLNPKASERTGYPTQKPILLLERIIELCTDEKDWVLDPFCGSGTSIVASTLLHRNAIGIDISSEAIELTKRRLKEPTKTESNLLKRGRESYRQANKKLEELLDDIDFIPVHRNRGIDAILVEQIQGRPVFIRLQRETETLIESAQLLYRASKDKQASALILIANNDQYDLFSDNVQDIVPSVIVIESPGLSIKKKLQSLQHQMSNLED